MRQIQEELFFRQLNNSDTNSVRELAEFLSVCYKHRAQKGISYLPDSQDEETTRRRMEDAESWVAEQDGRIVASFTIVLPQKTGGSWWYRQPGVSEINQIAVHPDCQGQGYFSVVLDVAEKRAMDLGIRELAGSVPAQRKELLRAYLRREYRIVDYKWKKGCRYGSIIFSKTICGSPLKSGPLRRLSRKLKYFRRYIKYDMIRPPGGRMMGKRKG